MHPGRFLLASLLAALVVSVPAAQAPREGTDLDALMAAVLSRRDENWTKLAQYVLDERETFTLSGPDGGRLYGTARDFRWFVRDGFFVRSPLVADGVPVGERDRVAYETRWLARQRARDTRGREGQAGPTSPLPADAAAAGDVLRQQIEPRFISAAYFLRFRFERGRYALVGRETVEGREALRIEYYPSALFADDGTRTERRARRTGGRDDDEVDDEAMRARMNKASLVTLWVLRDARQIIRYTFDDIDMDFLPGRSFVRVEGLNATMTMGEPFPGVWLPAAIDGRLRLRLASGPLEAHYAIVYRDYRQAEVTSKVRPK